jgi:hypothetical protein
LRWKCPGEKLVKTKTEENYNIMFVFPSFCLQNCALCKTKIQKSATSTAMEQLLAFQGTLPLHAAPVASDGENDENAKPAPTAASLKQVRMFSLFPKLPPPSPRVA